MCENYRTLSLHKILAKRAYGLGLKNPRLSARDRRRLDARPRALR